MPRSDPARLHRLVISATPPPAPIPLDDTREQVVDEFRRKATAVGFPERELRDVMSRLIVAQVPAGKKVDWPGDAANTPGFVSLVGSGCVKLVVFPPVLDPVADPAEEPSRIVVQFAKPSFVIGLTPTPMTAAARGAGPFAALAHVDSTVVFMSLGLMRQMTGRTRPGTRLLLVAYHARALSRLIFEKCRLLNLGVRERLLLELHEIGRLFPGERPGSIQIPLSHQDLAELTGASRFTVLRALSGLHDEVRVEGRRYSLARSAPAFVARPPVLAPPAPTGVTDRSNWSRVVQGLFKPLRPSRRITDLLVRGARLVRCGAEEPIAGGGPGSVTVLVTGAARIMVDVGAGAPACAWIAKPGHFIGLEQETNYPTAFWPVALTECEVAILSPEVMKEVLGLFSPEQMLVFLGICHEALSRQLYDRCVLLGQTNVERVLYQLHRLALDFGVRTHDGRRIRLPLRPRRDIGALAALEPSGVSRAITALQDAGRLRVEDDGSLVVVTRSRP